MPDKPPLKPVVLVILSGWGVAPPSEGNAIGLAKTPNFDRLASHYKTFVLNAAGESVGLAEGEPGNSEVGHLNIGAGKIIYQMLPKIDSSIRDGSFFNKKVFIEAVKHIKKHKSALHLLGLISEAKVHSSLEHLYALLELARQNKLTRVYLHLFLDGVDSPKDKGVELVNQVQNKIQELDIGEIASLNGQFYAMDRDNHWDRTEKAYLAIVEGETEKKCLDPVQAITDSYKQEIYDKEFLPTVIERNGQPIGKVENNDAVIFFNFRPDRVRQLTRAFVMKEFDKFERLKFLDNLFFVTMTRYEKDLPVEVVFSPEEIKHPLAEVISKKGLKQLHIAETEKYAYATSFFNGRREEPFSGEEDILVSGPDAASATQKPGMSAPEISKIVIQNILDGKYDFILVNFANLDVVTRKEGDISKRRLREVIKAAEAIDKALGNIIDTVLSKNGVALIAADHGNAEELIDLQTRTVKKENTVNPVPLILVGKEWGKDKEEVVESIDLSFLKPAGKLADIAPTILKIMKVRKPKEMTGRSLITNQSRI